MCEKTYKDIYNIFDERDITIGIAFSFDDMRNLVKGIQNAIDAGAKHIEITPLGRRGESRGFDTSSSDISEINRISRLSGVTFSVHAAPSLNMSGFDNNGFSWEIRNQSIREVKSTIDFARAINAKLVVLHPNSFPRPISNVDSGIFRDVGLINYYLIEPRTEQIVAVISEQDPVFVPQQAKDTRGNPLWILDRNRQPLLDSLSGEPIPRLVTDNTGRVRGKQLRFSEYTQMGKKEGKSLEEITLEFLRLQRSGEANRVHSSLIEAERTLSDAQIRRDRLQDTLDHYRNVDGVLSQEEKWRIEKIIPDRLNALGITVPSEVKSVVLLLEEELQANQRVIESAKQTIARGWPQLTQIIENYREIKLLDGHGLEKLCEAISEIGEYAITQSDKNPIQIAIENLPSPQMYGSCANELLAIILGARKKLGSLLKNRGQENFECKKIAHKTIGATLDIGHLNLYRSVYKGDAFHRWMISQVKELNKENDIFNVHLSDNRGIDDSHLPLGEGNTPVKEILGVLAEDDYRGYLIVEGVNSPEATKHSFNLFGITPRSTDGELIREFVPRQAFYGLFNKDDPDRPWFGKKEED